jgi:hypothetical protein
MSDKNFKPISVEDFGLDATTIEELVKGAQRFLAPVDDPADSETAPLTPPESD